VSVPSGVDVKIEGCQVTAKGPKGESKLTLHAGIEANFDDNRISIQAAVGKEKELSAFHGLDRALVQNLIVGVSSGFTKKLEIQGTGYQAKLSGNKVELQMGFAHPVFVEIPKGVTVEVPDPTKITVTGIDRQQVGQVAADIRKVRPPEPYKGKGIRYEGEQVRRKAGKTMGT